MYSPKIDPELIPLLYKIRVAEGIPMTKIVNRVLRAYIDKKAEPTEEKPTPDSEAHIHNITS